MDGSVNNQGETASVAPSPDHQGRDDQSRRKQQESRAPKSQRATPTRRADRGSYSLALAANLPNLPSIAAIACLATAIAPPFGVTVASFHFMVTAPLITGLLLTLVVWLVLGALYTRYLVPGVANETSYFALELRLNRVKALLDALECATPQGNTVEWEASKSEGQKNYDSVLAELEKRDLRWADATGYINAWFGVHAAEEALIGIAPISLVLDEAVFDELRLAGSTISNRDAMLAELKSARAVLGAATGTTNEVDTQKARSVVREVREAINDFRDSTWSGMVRARNRLIVTMMATGLLADLIIALAIIVGVSSEALIAATMFFLVGAIVGCFSLLEQSVE